MKNQKGTLYFLQSNGQTYLHFFYALYSDLLGTTNLLPHEIIEVEFAKLCLEGKLPEELASKIWNLLKYVGHGGPYALQEAKTYPVILDRLRKRRHYKSYDEEDYRVYTLRLCPCMYVCPVVLF